MIGKRFTAPSEVCDSVLIQVVGSEKREPDSRVKIRGTGVISYWCAEVVDGNPRGFWFAVGSDELDKFEQVDELQESTPSNATLRKWSQECTPPEDLIDIEEERPW